jgi:hypothetical protein
MTAARVLVLFAIAIGLGAQNKLPKFMGREVTIQEPELEGSRIRLIGSKLCTLSSASI